MKISEPVNMDMPTIRRTKRNMLRLRLSDLTVGQMVQISDFSHHDFVKYSRSISSTACQLSRKNGAKYSVRRISETVIGVWRIA